MTGCYRVVGSGMVAAVRPEAGAGRQVLLDAAVHARTEVQLHVKPACRRGQHLLYQKKNEEGKKLI